MANLSTLITNDFLVHGHKRPVLTMFQLCFIIVGQKYMNLPKIETIAKTIFNFFCMFCLC